MNNYFQGPTNYFSIKYWPLYSYATTSTVVSVLWAGTGNLDVITGWKHNGYGIDNSQSMYTGTNGLDLTGLTNNVEFTFERYPSWIEDTDITYYDFISLWLYINNWESDKHLQVNLDRENVFNSNTLNVDYYVNLTIIKQWQKIYIPLYDFNIPFSAGQLKYVNKLGFVSRGNINLYIDNIVFIRGKIVTKVVSVCSPVVVGKRLGVKVLSGKEIELEES